MQINGESNTIHHFFANAAAKTAGIPETSLDVAGYMHEVTQGTPPGVEDFRQWKQSASDEIANSLGIVFGRMLNRYSNNANAIRANGPERSGATFGMPPTPSTLLQQYE